MSLFSCPTCLHRVLHNFTIESPLQSSLLCRAKSRCSQTLVNSTNNKIARRHHATYDSIVRGHHRRALRLTLTQKKPLVPNARRKGAGSLTKGEIKDALARQNNRDRLLSKDDGTQTSNLSPQERRKQTQLKKEIEQYYSDPLQLANVVISKLRTPDFEAAIAFVRASEGIVTKNVVSWNHCIDWCMSQGDTDKAWKLYNELKKRGNKPDSHTYTIMLRGLSQNSKRAGSAQRAVGIYNSMFAPNSAVEPNTIHTNAVLNVCARANDLESMWAIAGRLPERGPGCPDRWTYTTILNAIKENAITRVADLLKNPKRVAVEKSEESQQELSLEERQKVIFDEALRDGRKLWQDVSFRWRRADLVVDEQLVCAMGRLILGCGTRKDFGEVFDLVDSTMNVKLAERGYKKGAAADAEQGEDVQDLESPEDTTEMTMAPVDKSLMPLSEQQVYATPGNNTLSLILEAATGTKEMKVGKAYWHLLTDPTGPHKVSPDADNIISYLRLLRISRASKDALEVLSRDWPAQVAEKLYRRGTFVIAMSTCVRDKNNPGVFDIADKLLGLMQTKLEESLVGMYDKIEATETDPNLSYKERQAIAKARVANLDEVTFGEAEALSELQRTKSGVESSTVDPKALKMYLDLAVLKTTGWNEGQLEKDDAKHKFERDPKKNFTLRALRRLGPETVNISRLAKLKLHEAEVSLRAQTNPASAKPKYDLSPNAQRRTSDRAGTRVAEKLGDMIDLLRSVTGAYDKVISIDERFEDLGRPQLDKKLIQDYRDLKRRVSSFLSRTKDEVAKLTRGDLRYVKWRNTTRDEDDLDDDDEEAPRRFGLSSRPKPTEIPKIGRDVQRIYEDTDRSLGRLDQRSRRQKQERRNGVDRRMSRRLGMGQDHGVLDDDLSIAEKKTVEEKMRQRALRINTQNVGRERSVRQSAAASA